MKLLVQRDGGHMTLDEFLKQLKTLVKEKKTKFRVLKDGSVRARGFCPVCYVAHHLKGTKDKIAFWNVTDSIDLDPYAADSVASAADDNPNFKDVRRKLLRACNVKERA